jgi:cell wall-associated NlpC family hydrolase
MPSAASLSCSGLAALLLAACATQLAEAPPSAAQPAGGKALAFQQKSLAPASGERAITAAELNSADILLSAEASLRSSGIRLLTFAPVSHAAIYLGDASVAEALGGGVGLRGLPAMLAEESVIAVYRAPGVDAAVAARIVAEARARVGRGYDFAGAVLYLPFSAQRQACELPGLPSPLRDACIRLLASVQLGVREPEERFFCSAFVLDAYRDAGLPLTTARARWLTPADILHMREGDVPALPVAQPLIYVGHLKTTPWAMELPAFQLLLPRGYPVPLLPPPPP